MNVQGGAKMAVTKQSIVDSVSISKLIIQKKLEGVRLSGPENQSSRDIYNREIKPEIREGIVEGLFTAFFSRNHNAVSIWV